MKLITTKHLRGACRGQAKLFARVFPYGASVTLANVRKARTAGLRVSWLARLLTPEARAGYNRFEAEAWAEYERVTAPALAEYERAADAALVKLLRRVPE